MFLILVMDERTWVSNSFEQPVKSYEKANSELISMMVWFNRCSTVRICQIWCCKTYLLKTSKLTQHQQTLVTFVSCADWKSKPGYPLLYISSSCTVQYLQYNHVYILSLGSRQTPNCIETGKSSPYKRAIHTLHGCSDYNAFRIQIHTSGTVQAKYITISSSSHAQQTNQVWQPISRTRCHDRHSVLAHGLEPQHTKGGAYPQEDFRSDGNKQTYHANLPHISREMEGT